MLEQIVAGFIVAGLLLGASENSDEVKVQEASAGWAAPAETEEFGISPDFFSEASDEAAKY